MTATPVIGTTFFGLDVSGLGVGLKAIRRRISRSILLIEFGSRMLQIAEARQRSHGLEIRHLSKIALPEGALERSVPVEPEVMAQLLRDLCEEKSIISHRASVVLPPELAFQRLVQLPDGLSVKEARNYLLDPRNGLSLPFPLGQTDFDLVPMNIFNSTATKSGFSTFQLSAIPSSLVEPVMSMLNGADFDLQTLEFGSFSALRCIEDVLLCLGPSSICLLLDFLPDATLVNFVCSEGLIESERLSSVREFPRYEISDLQREQILQRSHSLEAVTVANERYLPLSEMDIRAFVHDLQGVLNNFLHRYPASTLDQILVMGEGSSHPDLPGLLQLNLNCSVKLVRPLLTRGVREWALDDTLLQSSLTRLVGLGLGILGAEEKAIDQSDLTPDRSEQDSLAFESLEDESDGSNLAELAISLSPADFSPTSLDSSEDDTITSVEIQTQEVEVVAKDSERPTINLNLIEDGSAPVVEIDLDVDAMPRKSEVSFEKDESKWPSIKLETSRESNSELPLDPNTPFKENIIPGLSTSDDQPDDSKDPSIIDQQSDLDPTDLDESPLGELRIKD